MTTALEAAATLLEENGHPFSANLLRLSIERGAALDRAYSLLREVSNLDADIGDEWHDYCERVRGELGGF
jgi:hypothetical protein